MKQETHKGTSEDSQERSCERARTPQARRLKQNDKSKWEQNGKRPYLKTPTRKVETGYESSHNTPLQSNHAPLEVTLALVR